MLVLISDLHISDNSTSSNVDGTAFVNILGPSIKDSMSPNNKNAKELHIVLLGDIFDLVRTDHWVANVAYNDRPWNGTLDPLTAMNNNNALINAQFDSILDKILATPSAKGLISMLDSFAPGVNGNQTKITYVVGNHDRILNNFPSLQNKIKSALSTNLDVSFVSKVEEENYGVLARHGHEYDKECYAIDLWNDVMHEDNRLNRFAPELSKMMAIGEVLTAELMAGFIFKINEIFKNKGWNSPTDTEFLHGLFDVNTLRPMTSMFVWLRWYSRNQEEKYQQPLKDALLFALDNVLNSKLADQWDNTSKPILFRGYLAGDITDRLDAARDDLRAGGLAKVEESMTKLLGLKSIVDFFVRNNSDDDLLKGAEQEFNDPLLNRNIQYIVYGHTHEARQDFFKANLAGKVSMYINTGTYLPFIQLCRDQKGFAFSHLMTMTFFYKEDEDVSNRKGSGPTCELWNGIRRKYYI
jgi:UDP-2,3-diacylglucosamine pyrophosphatase LpxH